MSSLHRGVDLAGHVQGVGARELEDGDAGGRLAADLEALVVDLAAQLDAGDVLDAGQPRCRVGVARSPALTMMSSNCSGSLSRPRVVTVYWKLWSSGDGGWPIWPAATCTFCSRIAAQHVLGRQARGP